MFEKLSARGTLREKERGRERGKEERERKGGWKRKVERKALHRARYPQREVVRCGRYIHSGL